MVYHLYNASMSHLAPTVLGGILFNAQITFQDGMDGTFIIIWLPDKLLFGTKETEIEKYISLFRFYNFVNYAFVEGNFGLIKAIYKIRNEADKLVIHSNFNLFGRYPIFLAMLGLRGKSFLRRCIKVEWSVQKELAAKGLVKILTRTLQRRIYAQLGWIIALTSEDKMLLESRFVNSNIRRASYLGSIDSAINKHQLKINPGDKLKILLSHSGHVHNNHIRSLDLLSKFKASNIEITCPLCYGPASHIEKVISYGKSIFGDKFGYFTELKPLEQYLTLISKQHVYITSAEIQTGLFAANTALANGLKVYLGDNLFKSLMSSGYIYFNVRELEDVDYQSFAQPLSKDEFRENQTIYREWLINGSVNTWKEIYNA